MKTLIVVNNPNNWPLKIAGVQVVSARSYLAEGRYSTMRRGKVFNLCRSYRYQSVGYYVSLLAAARGHKPLPSVSTIQDLKSQTIIRFVSDDLDELIQRSLAPILTDQFILSIYFGRNIARRYDRLSTSLFKLFQAPLLRAFFSRREDKWELQNINPIAVSEIPQEHRPFCVQFAEEYLGKKRVSAPRVASARYDLAILAGAEEKQPPSDEKAIRKFVRAAESLGFGVEVIDREDYGRVAEFDALFIRETTSVHHHTYRFSRRAAAEGLVVIDDPESILKCTNKVYLAELMHRYRIPTPRTVVVSSENVNQALGRLGLPCILKQPDSSFSQGVTKVEDAESYQSEVERLLEKSDLIIAQEFLPTAFDWRVGIINREAIYVCRYHMARKHWQIIKSGAGGKVQEGRVESVAVKDAPPKVVETALKAANLIGDGLYGVDIKESGRTCYVIEINDNPSIDAGYEDAVLKDDLYLKIMSVFLERVEARKRGSAP